MQIKAAPQVNGVNSCSDQQRQLCVSAFIITAQECLVDGEYLLMIYSDQRQRVTALLTSVGKLHYQPKSRDPPGAFQLELGSMGFDTAKLHMLSSAADGRIPSWNVWSCTCS